MRRSQPVARKPGLAGRGAPQSIQRGATEYLRRNSSTIFLSGNGLLKDQELAQPATCAYRPATISFACSSVFASATIRIIGSVFEPLTRNQPSGLITFTPSRVSI